MGERLRRIQRPEEWPWLRRWVQTVWGKTTLFLVFSWLFVRLYQLPPGDQRNPAWQLLLAALACSIAARYRAQVLAVTTLLLLGLAPDWFPNRWLLKFAEQQGVSGNGSGLRYLALAAVLSLAPLLVWLRRRFPRALPARWPLLSLLILYGAALALACSDRLVGATRVFAFGLVWALSAYLWHIGYALRDAANLAGRPVWWQMASFHPYFGGTFVAIGLGAANLSQRMVRDGEQLAICQIKALKLLIHCCLMGSVRSGMAAGRQHLGLPLFEELIRHQLSGTGYYSRGVCWASLVFSFFEGIAASYMVGNLLVTCARLGGFQLLQQVYRPLGARSLCDFWNRTSFYYKQVVVDMFFYPSFLGYFKTYPALRQAFAVFMAAGVGNLIYHLRNALEPLSRLGLQATLQGMQTYVCYCILLCSGLFISQLRAQKRKSSPQGIYAALALVRIVLFYSLLAVFDEIYTLHSPIERLGFVGFLLGL